MGMINIKTCYAGYLRKPWWQGNDDKL